MRIIVLNDGETYTTAKGCALLDVPDHLEDAQIKDVMDYVSVDPNFSLGPVFVDDADSMKAIEVRVEVIARF